MLNLMFFIKTILITVLIVLILQIRFGSLTLEDHARHFIQTSALAQPVQDVAESGAVAVRKGMNWVTREINQRVRGHWFAEARKNFNLHRSEGYHHNRGKAKERADNDATP